MNHHEIETCVIKAKTGNTEALLKLMEQYKPFIFKTAKDYNIKGFDVYDLAQLGYITLINCTERYKIGSHTFSSYAFNAIKNAFRYAARQNNKYAEEYSLNAPVQNDDFEGSEYIECIASTVNIEEDLIKLEDNKRLKGAIAALSEAELEFVIMVYFSNITVKTYAEKKGLSYIQAIRFKNKILEKLLNKMRTNFI
ncbi:sigma-70 family RNA polymerase sigma factor [Candidatus Clostridium stratigraminis]|uniref:Sigma-70 family RNA polymerase sigma factor n=1 Tax=Candidatus Clostridium stratigraminis TaxID=3381661 RepID=A0ABW8T0Z2_9CLOT